MDFAGFFVAGDCLPDEPSYEAIQDFFA